MEGTLHLAPLIAFDARMRTTQVGATPAGHRLNMELEGESRPDGRVAGRIEGLDWLTLRPDGVAELDVRATLTTPEDEVVAVRATGLAELGADGVAAGRLTLRFQTGSEALGWLNRVVGVAATRADMNAGTLELTAYSLEG